MDTPNDRDRANNSISSEDQDSSSSEDILLFHLTLPLSLNSSSAAGILGKLNLIVLTPSSLHSFCVPAGD